MPHFVLLYHACPTAVPRPSHWDFMLESGEVLETWAVAQLPQAWRAAQIATAETDPTCPAIAAANSVAVARLSDHRRDYLEFEGPLSGNRGHVRRIDRGGFRREELAPNAWRLHLAGRVVQGVAVLKQSHDDRAKWILDCDAARQPPGSFDDVD